MTRFLPGVLTAGCLALASPAAAQWDPLEAWVDACHAGAPDLQGLLGNNALIVSDNVLYQNDDGSYGLDAQPFVQAVFPRPYPLPPLVFDLCPQARFYGQTQVVEDVVRRSAVQVGPDLVLTTWHNPFDPAYLKDYVVIFGLHARDVGGSCVFPDFGHIPPSQVYRLDAVAADGWDQGLDMLLLRLDRVAGNNYPRVRRSGRGWPDDNVTLIGHPARMAAKVDLAGRAGETRIEGGREWLYVERLHRLNGSSGSMVYNRTQRILETAAEKGLGLDFEWIDPQACYLIVHEPGFQGLNASLRHFAENIPAFELLVDSLDPVVHVTSVGGTLVNPTERTVSAPAAAAGPIAYEIVPPAPPGPDEPALTITTGAPPAATLAPGQGFEIQEYADIGGVTTCGRRERSYAIHDRTHGFVDLARHVFEIGIREFVVTPDGRPAMIEDVALPLDGTAVYHLANPRPDPVTVRVSADKPWVTLSSGGTIGAPFLDVTLAPDAPPTAVTVGVSFPTEPEPYPHQYHATLSFDFTPGTPCPGSGATTRQLIFVYGHETFVMSADVAIPDSNLSAAVVTLDVPETFCVADVNAIVRTSTVPGSHLRVRLVSPLGVRRQLWDRGPLAVPLDVKFDDEGAFPPLTSLSVFDGQPGGGTWVFRVEDWVPGILGALHEWGLEFTACPAP